jgi:ubiquitin C-terminal hydrolase
MIHAIKKDDYQLIKLYQDAKDTEGEWQPRHQYRLYGVVCHSGSMSGGHYIAYTCYYYKGKKYWFYMSDSFVE